MTHRNHRIALIPGDGIGAEVLPPARRVLDAVGRRRGIGFSYTSYDWSCERYVREGSMMPADGLDRLREADAILLGAIGYPGVPDPVSLWGLLIPIRRTFRQYVELRPIRVFEGVDSPLRSAAAGEIDLVVVRENVEGEYSEIAPHRRHPADPGQRLPPRPPGRRHRGCARRRVH
ncbi:isocitrate/isopropylmalate family dehydrogenase, partial [Streptomyces sp. NPDC002787]